MNTQRITAQTKANIAAADRAELIKVGEGQIVKVWKADRAAFICGSLGPVIYPHEAAARRAVKRIAPNLELTSFS